MNNSLICVLRCDHGYTYAVVTMYSIGIPQKPGVQFHVRARKLPLGPKGFHVHQTGNLQEGCASLGPHYNPTSTVHGNLNDPNAHRGDLGNILINKNGYCDMVITSNYLTLGELLGRSLVIHRDKDDLGQGGNPESLKTGNSGARICCGVIGLAYFNFEYIRFDILF